MKGQGAEGSGSRQKAGGRWQEQAAQVAGASGAGGSRWRVAFDPLKAALPPSVRNASGFPTSQPHKPRLRLPRRSRW